MSALHQDRERPQIQPDSFANHHAQRTPRHSTRVFYFVLVDHCIAQPGKTTTQPQHFTSQRMTASATQATVARDPVNCFFVADHERRAHDGTPASLGGVMFQEVETLKQPPDCDARPRFPARFTFQALLGVGPPAPRGERW